MKIKEVEKQLHISAQTIRYYEDMNLIEVKREKNGYRFYDEDNITTLKKIIFFRNLDFSIHEIKELLEDENNFLTILEAHTKRLQEQVKKAEHIKEILVDYNMQKLPMVEILSAVPDKELSYNEILKEIMKYAIKK